MYLSRNAGGPVSEVEARTLLSTYGAIEAVWHATETERELNGLPEGMKIANGRSRPIELTLIGIWLRFHYFDDFRDAQNVRLVQKERRDLI